MVIKPPRGKNAGAVGAFEAVASAVFLIAAAVAAIVFAVASVKVVDALLVAAAVHRRQPRLHAPTVGLVGPVVAIRMPVAHLPDKRGKHKSQYINNKNYSRTPEDKRGNQISIQQQPRVFRSFVIFS